MFDVVADASVIVRLALSTEKGHAEARDVYRDGAAAGVRFLTCDLAPYEVGNAFLRGDTTTAEKIETLLLALETVDLRRPGVDALASAMEKAVRGRLSFYDATYGALAESAGALLWTEDQKLAKAFPDRSVDTLALRRKLRSSDP